MFAFCANTVYGYLVLLITDWILIMEKRMYSVGEFVEISGLSRNGVYKLVKSGDIPSVRIGKRILIQKASADALLGGLLNGEVQ